MAQGRVRELIEELDTFFAASLTSTADSRKAWSAVTNLRRRGSHLVFTRAAAWCFAPHPLKRARGAAILGQLGIYPQRGNHRSFPVLMFRNESFDLILRMLKTETNVFAIGAAVVSLGHLENVAAVQAVVPFASHSHENVRFAVAYTLGCYHSDPKSIEALQKLMEDPDRNVRDWAIFGLGVLGDADSEELRAQFLKHLDDPFLDARIEAAAALGKRRDPRLAKPLVKMLRRDGALNGITEAARELLGLDEDPEDWFEDEYIAAIERKFAS